MKVRNMANLNEQYEVELPEIKQVLRDIAVRIKNMLPKEWGFTLFLFSYGEDRSLFYISSARREDMISSVKEWLAKQDAKSANSI